MKLSYIVQRIHAWLGLLIGAQIILWTASGVIMSWFHITLVRGEGNAAADYAIELEARSYASPGGIIAQSSGATELRLRRFLGRPVYEAISTGGAAMFDAETGEKLTPISDATARAVAIGDFVGEGEIRAVELLSEPPPEYGRKGPVWRVTFTDDLETRLYISPNSGAVEARRNKVWRLYDFFWMLHIMDYDKRVDFNNPLIRATSATALLFALTGAFMVVVRLRSGRYARKGARASAPGDAAGPKIGKEKSPRSGVFEAKWSSVRRPKTP